MRALLPVVLLLGACTPLTRYRQSILVPVPEPPVGFGAPLADGDMAFGASFSGNLQSQGVDIVNAEVPTTDLSAWFPQPGDPGLWVAPFSFDVHARMGVADAVDLGARFEYADGNTANRSSLGVMEIPGHPPLWGAGAFMTIGKTPQPWGVGFTVEGTLYSMPWARYAYNGPSDWDWALGDGTEYYQIIETGACNPILLRASLAAEYRWRILDLSFGGALSPQVTNNGFFDDDEVPAWDGGPLSFMPVMDLGFTAPVVHVGFQGWWAMSTLEPSNGLILGPGGRMVIEYRAH